MSNRRKNDRPWTAFYRDVPANLKYPNISIVDLIKKTVFDKTGKELKLEIEIIGE